MLRLHSSRNLLKVSAAYHRRSSSLHSRLLCKFHSHTGGQKATEEGRLSSVSSTGTAKVVQLPFMETSSNQESQESHKPYIVGVAGEQILCTSQA